MCSLSQFSLFLKLSNIKSYHIDPCKGSIGIGLCTGNKHLPHCASEIIRVYFCSVGLRSPYAGDLHFLNILSKEIMDLPICLSSLVYVFPMH